MDQRTFHIDQCPSVQVNYYYNSPAHNSVQKIPARRKFIKN